MHAKQPSIRPGKRWTTSRAPVWHDCQRNQTHNSDHLTSCTPYLCHLPLRNASPVCCCSQLMQHAPCNNPHPCTAHCIDTAGLINGSCCSSTTHCGSRSLTRPSSEQSSNGRCDAVTLSLGSCRFRGRCLGTSGGQASCHLEGIIDTPLQQEQHRRQQQQQQRQRQPVKKRSYLQCCIEHMRDSVPIPSPSQIKHDTTQQYPVGKWLKHDKRLCVEFQVQHAGCK